MNKRDGGEDPGEMITFTHQYFDDSVRRAFDEGSELKHAELLNFLFSICEIHSRKFRPANVSAEKFFEFTLQALIEEFNKKYKGQRDPNE